MAERTIAKETLLIIYGILVFFTITTYVVALADLGRWNTPVALLFAAIKAALIVLFFMHIRYSRWLLWVVIGVGLFWIGIMFTLTLSDYLTRGWG